MCLSCGTLLPTIYTLIAHGMFLTVSPLLMVMVLIGFKARVYNTVKAIIFFLMTIIPFRYPSTPLVLLTPLLIFATCVQILVQTLSDRLMLLHLIIQTIGFYFLGMDRISERIKRMGAEELDKGLRATVILTFPFGVLTVLCWRSFTLNFQAFCGK